MAKMTADQLIDAFKELTLIELSDFVKKFEEEFDVTAAAPVAVMVLLQLCLRVQRRMSLMTPRPRLRLLVAR